MASSKSPSSSSKQSGHQVTRREAGDSFCKGKLLKLAKRVYELDGRKVTAFFREGTSDDRVMDEVISKRTYRRQRVGFDVENGEHWLDLGANVGAFALYCELRNATAECFEPEPQCFDILQVNAKLLDGFTLHNKAVTTQDGAQVSFYVSGREGEHYYGNTIRPRRGFREIDTVNNLNIAKLSRKRYDGIKMDIEGGEGPLIDSGLLPRARKLCMEYHTSADRSVANFHRRMKLLRSLYEFVQYPKEFDTAKQRGDKEIKTFFDRTIYAWNP